MPHDCWIAAPDESLRKAIDQDGRVRESPVGCRATTARTYARLELRHRTVFSIGVMMLSIGLLRHCLTSSACQDVDYVMADMAMPTSMVAGMVLTVADSPWRHGDASRARSGGSQHRG